MQAILDALNNPIALTIAVLILLAVALFVFLKLSNERDSAVNARLGEVEKRLAEKFDGAQSASSEQARKGREEMGDNLRGMSDSVTRAMSEMARTQQAQLDAFAGQLRDMSRVDEQRMEAMRKTVEERLAAYEDRMDRMGEMIDGKLDKNELRVERMRQTLEERMQSLQADHGRRMAEMQRAFDDQMGATLDRRLGESFRQVSDRLDQVYRGLGEMQSLASGVGDLKRVLTNVKTRGLVGEIQLGAMLAQLMSDEQYVQDAQIVAGGARAPYAIRLPGATSADATILLPIDAQFPEEAYQRLLDALDASDQQAAERLGAELEQKLTAAAERIRDQFIKPPATTDFAVLFLGSEGLYAEALRRPGFTERLQRDFRVTLTGPSTLAALLNSLQMGFKTLALERRSEEVWALLGAVRGEFETFVEALNRTQKRIRQASESIEDAAQKSRTIQKKLKGVRRVEEPARKALFSGEEEAPDSLYGEWD